MLSEISFDNPIRAFTADQVCRLTGLPDRRLRYWDATEFFRPESARKRRGPYSRLYSFRDVVGLRTLAILRNRASLQSLRKIGAWLHEHYEHPWASLRFFTRGRDVFVQQSDDVIVLAKDGAQSTFDIELQDVIGEVSTAVHRLRQRQEDDVGRISKHRYVAHNRPVISGTRIPTSAIWAFHKAGYESGAIISEFPTLTIQDVNAAIRFHESDDEALAS